MKDMSLKAINKKELIPARLEWEPQMSLQASS